jgi:glycogen synthase
LQNGTFVAVRILLVSRFAPSLGGLETMGALVAREWSRLPGVELKVVTNVPGTNDDSQAFELIRCPGLKKLDACYRWADAIFFNHCYLKMSLPLVWRRKPYVISMSGTLDCPVSSLKGVVQLALLRRLLVKADRNIAACRHVQLRNKVDSRVIPNPYDSEVYHVSGLENIARDRNFLFGGRINQAAKGCFDLFEAFVICRNRTGRDLTLTIAGDGPDLPKLRSMATQAGISHAIRFCGVLSGPALAEEMRRHEVIVVPSRYQEPIGIICLEGIACGCIAVASAGGGLAESVGPCGFTYPNGDVEALADAMYQALSMDEESRRSMRRRSDDHLDNYQPGRVAQAYLEILKAGMDRRLPAVPVSSVKMENQG